ncbi:beta family protein [Brucella pseudogrignonensis]|uniref:beta family protein n=1 Tax=Brucella pseudogrignonensis TaxID=419475 RepID=UPI0038B68C0A
MEIYQKWIFLIVRAVIFLHYSHVYSHTVVWIRMFALKTYFPALSTRVHEQLAYAKCSDAVKDAVVPIVTLTRYDKASTLAETAEILIRDLAGRPAIVDFDPQPRQTTSIEEDRERRRRKAEEREEKGLPPSRERSAKELANDKARKDQVAAFNVDLSRFTDPVHGVVRWVDMITDLPGLLPVIKPLQIEDQINVILRKKVQAAIRLDPFSENEVKACIEAGKTIRGAAEKLIIILDFKTILGRYNDSLKTGRAVISRLTSVLDSQRNPKIVILANSFPESKTSLKNYPSILSMEERKLHHELSDQMPLFYGDYMSIAPRTGSSKGGQGWFPHVDLVTEDDWHIHLYESNGDQAKYIDACEDAVRGGYWRNCSDCWGKGIIDHVHKNKMLEILGKKFTVPAPWLSVRANQHLTRMALHR